ncbi:unnamed protein product [Pleuronectes platessa]|uniref:Uncharacterized protein n=1 Tax=Pleuronectes platessa TaxID=8262 RepID=A0A9N7Y5M6_PLEPL|nr:unnamed protein product [Pleuronectes platessa]
MPLGTCDTMGPPAAGPVHLFVSKRPLVCRPRPGARSVLSSPQLAEGLVLITSSAEIGVVPGSTNCQIQIQLLVESLVSRLFGAGTQADSCRPSRAPPTSFRSIVCESLSEFCLEKRLKTPVGQRTEDRGERKEDRGQRTEDRGRRTEDRGHRTEDGGTLKLSGESWSQWDELSSFSLETLLSRCVEERPTPLPPQHPIPPPPHPTAPPAAKKSPERRRTDGRSV